MAEVDETLKKKRTFRKFTFRGVDLDQLLDMPNEQLMELMHARARRRFARGLKRKPMALVKKLRRAKKEAPPNEKPEIVKTHLRNMIIVPEMVGSIVGIYNGKTFNQGLVPQVTPDEVLWALHRMKNRKAVGPDGVPIEAWKSLGSRGVGILTHLFNRILLTGKRLSIITPVFKGEGSVQECSNYRGIKVMSHSMKLLNRGRLVQRVEIKPEMIGHYLGEFSVTYKPVKHGRPGIGATHSSRFIPLK